jgi:putative ABC transport system substrate-binding protein
MSGTRISLALSVALLVAGCASPATNPEARAEATIAFLRAVGSATSDGQQALLDELRKAGFDDDSNLTVLAADPEIAYPDPDDAAEIVAEWVEDGVDLIFALSSSGAMAASQAAPDVPVLFISNDPTATGLIQNETQPEANLTGVTFRVPADRTLSIAARAIPHLRKVGLVYPADDPGAVPHAAAVEAAAEQLGLDLEMANFTDETDAAKAVDQLARKGVDAIFISNSPTAIRALGPIQEAADAAGIPTIANTAVSVGSLIVLGPSSLELNRQLGRQAARILAGSEVADVPVEDPREFELVLNAAVADRLSVVLKPNLLREADRVIR